VDYVKSEHRASVRALGLHVLAEIFGELDVVYDNFDHSTRGYGVEDFEAARGTIKAARRLVENNWLSNTRGLIAAEIFRDYLDMAEHLSDEGYKDAAAVLAGSSLEAHLKRLTVKHGIKLTQADSKGVERPKKADTLNADLVKANAYDGGEGKQVVAWLGVRNEAAHGNYDRVNAEVVKLMIPVCSFVARRPA
jgi:hypothetical protein